MANDETTRILIRNRPSVGSADPTVVDRNKPSEHRNDDELTRVYRPKSYDRGEGGDGQALGGAAGASVEPVVGWLVVTDGPGRGRSLQLGYGANAIGRNETERVSLNFGDEEISRKSHALLVYDGKNRKFYLQHGEGTNLTYLGNEPVLQPTQLHGREMIGVGNTKLCFIPFCGTEFEW